MADVTAVHWGMRKERNSASDSVDEYIERKRLAKMGVTVSAETLSAKKADIFLLIDSELDRLRANDAKEARKKR